MKFKAFNLIELMVVIAIIAILAAVALPMYSNFQRKAKASLVLKSVVETRQALQAWYQNRGSFSNLNVNATDFRTIMDGTERVGVSFGSVANMPPSNINLVAADKIITVNWSDFTGCTRCSGTWCIKCDDDNCWTTSKWAFPDELGQQADSDATKGDACS